MESSNETHSQPLESRRKATAETAWLDARAQRAAAGKIPTSTGGGGGKSAATGDAQGHGAIGRSERRSRSAALRASDSEPRGDPGIPQRACAVAQCGNAGAGIASDRSARFRCAHSAPGGDAARRPAAAEPARRLRRRPETRSDSRRDHRQCRRLRLPAPGRRRRRCIHFPGRDAQGAARRSRAGEYRRCGSARTQTGRNRRGTRTARVAAGRPHRRAERTGASRAG